MNEDALKLGRTFNWIVRPQADARGTMQDFLAIGSGVRDSWGEAAAVEGREAPSLPYRG